MEMFFWREFKNRKEVGAFPGLTPTPYVPDDNDHKELKEKE